MTPAQALGLIEAELQRAQTKHPVPMRSFHEAHSIIEEEYDELKAEIFQQKRDTFAIQTEAVHLGAMAARLLVDLIGGWVKPEAK